MAAEIVPRDDFLILYRAKKDVYKRQVLMGYGHTIPEIGRAIQDGVKSAIESMTGLEVSVVNVSVAGITFPPKA